MVSEPGREAVEMGPELVVEPGAGIGLGASADPAEHLAVGLRLPPPPGRAAAGRGRVQRRGRCAAAAAGLGCHGRRALGFARGGEPGWWTGGGLYSTHGRDLAAGERRFIRGERRKGFQMGEVWVLSH